MNALIYADEYLRIEATLDAIAVRLAACGRTASSRYSVAIALSARRQELELRLTQLDGLFGYDAELTGSN